MEILVAEDDFYSAKFLGKLLEDLGHRVILAEDGRKAWDRFRERPAQMVIADWLMPEMDGLTLCRKIRESDLASYVYLILLTAKDSKEDAVLGLESGADDYVVKPFDPGELRARVQAGQRIIELEDERRKAHIQLLQSEKMASIGQLAAGVAHEINNPIGFILSNLGTLNKYVDKLTAFIRDQEEVIRSMEPNEVVAGLEEKRKRLKLDFVMEDIRDLIKESVEGADRVKKIVQNLKSFSRVDQTEYKHADLNECLEDTVNIVWNELKYKVTVEKEYGEIPLTKCYAQQLNQVFMNLLVNAAQAIEKQGTIRIKTWSENGSIFVSIADTGCGIPEEVRSKIFDPFFTTKEVGQGTGLGLSISYDIIKNHQGEIMVESEPGKGTTFTLRIPVVDAR